MSRELRSAYRSISQDYLQKKQDPWKDFVDFVSSLTLSPQSSLLDIGAGNGRNLGVIPSDLPIALDLSFDLLLGYVGPSQGQKIAGSLPHLPFRGNSVSCIISIAVLHHLRKQRDVLNSLQEFIRVGKDPIMIFSVWRKWRRGHREKIFQALRDGKSTDHLINHERPWYSSDRQVISHRFYHYYTFRELYDQLHKVGLQVDVVNYLGGRHDDANIFVQSSIQLESEKSKLF